MKVRSYDHQKDLIREMLRESNNKITRQQICDRLGIKLMCLYLWMRKVRNIWTINNLILFALALGSRIGQNDRL